VGWLLVSTPPIYAQESLGFEKIADVSSAEEFGVRISCVGEPEAYLEEENSCDRTSRFISTQSMLSQRS
jgi:hypothetical protein